MRNRAVFTAILAAILITIAVPAIAANLYGYLRDPCWWSRRYTSDPYGTGMYEFAINANGRNVTAVGGADFSDVFGYFDMTNLAEAGSTTYYNISSWSVWWRPAYVLNLPVASGGSAYNIDLRLRAAMWQYAAFWDDAGYYEFGQTFKATGPIHMIYLRCPGWANYTLTIHEGGPGGAQVGVSRSFSGSGDWRPIYGYGEMPTVAGNMYYLRLRTSSPSEHGVVMQMDPRADYSDPMPEGCLYLGTGGTPVAHPTRDLGCVIMCDDDGIITNMHTRDGGGNLTGCTTAGQTFIARGTSLISASIYSNTSNFIGVFRVLQGGPGGTQVGTTKRAKIGQWATPECVALWSPGECPLVPGTTYYLEVSMDGGSTFTAYANAYNPYAYGQAYRNGVAQTGFDLAGTIMEEESSGSATMSKVIFGNYPAVAEADRGLTSFTVRWTTNLSSDSKIEYAAENGPYTHSVYDGTQTTNHVLTVSGLKQNTMYHFRVTSSRTGSRPAISRDLVICTKSSTNLLTNGGFEEGTGASPRWPIPGWSKWGSVDIKASDGSWFWGIPPNTGSWLLEGAVNGPESDGGIYQRVSAVSGYKYTFSAFVTTWMRENDTWKYDVWYDRGRLEYMRLGIDPYGGTDPNSADVRWTPRMYSHLKYTNLATSVTAASNYVTVFVHMKGQGGQWHLYGVDDCVLTGEAPCTPPSITTHPVSQVKVEGQNVTFSVTASGSPTLNYQWRHNGENISGAKSSTYTIESVQASHAGTYDCVVTNSCGSATSNPATLQVVSNSSLSALKSLANNTTGGTIGRYVTAVFGTNSFYLEEADRSAGLLVLKSGHGLSVGMRADALGTMKTNSDGERYLEATSVVQNGSGTLDALAMVNRELGGTSWNYVPATGAGQRGVKNGTGLNNIGLLVWTTGKVTYVGSNFFYIDDGSALNDQSGYTGVRVMSEGLSLPSVGSMVKVTGISSCFASGADLYPKIRATQIN